MLFIPFIYIDNDILILKDKYNNNIILKKTNGYEYNNVFGSSGCRWWFNAVLDHDGCNLRYHVVLYDSSTAEETERNTYFQNSLKEGSSVVTGGGIYGTVKRIDLTTNKVELEIAKGVVITVDKGYVFADISATAAAVQKK